MFQAIDATNIMDIVSDIDLKDDSLDRTKSILHSPARVEGNESSGSLKRGLSKTQIQWKDTPVKAEEYQKLIKTSFPVLGLLASRNNKWQYLHVPILKVPGSELKLAKQSEDEVNILRSKACTNLIRDLGSEVLQERFNKNADLTLDQQTSLEILKHKVKVENEAYLRRHPEIDVLIKLVYAALFKNKPQNPKQFVSDYVHYLNKHREELIMEDVVIPFDPPPAPEETTEGITSEEEERQIVSELARKIVEYCINLAAHGESYVDIMSIINSMLKVVSPSEEEISIQSSILNAEAAVSEILMSLLTSVAIERSTSSELIVDEVLSSILSNALPYVHSGSRIHSEMKGSVEKFVESLIDQLTVNVWNEVILREEPGKGGQKKRTKGTVNSSIENDSRVCSRTILKKDEESRSEFKTKVKFQSIVKM